jgi:uncharacterized ParB-like nuclease family protein
MLKPLAIELLRIDGDTQSRVAINEETVEAYCEIITEADKTTWPFPPLDVFHDGTDHFVADGFHRFLAANRAGRGSVPCEIHDGTAQDARIWGLTANDRHGMRMSRADKRKCVDWLRATFPKMPQKELAEKAGVSIRTIKYIIAEDNTASLSKKAVPPKRDGKGQIAPDTPSRGEPERKKPAVDQPPVNEDAEPTQDYGKCPNCAGFKWIDDEDGVFCAKCRHPYGEPTGGVDEDRISTQRSKTIKTVEALMRAFDDLNLLLAKPEHKEAIATCKVLLKTAKGWK